MDIAQSSKAKSSKPQLSPYQEGVSKALKASGEQQATEAIMQGVPPQHIEQQAGLIDPALMQQLSQLAGQQVPVKSDGTMLGDKMGILPAILKSLSGTPTSPFDQKTQAMGMDNAIQLAGFQQTTNKNSMDVQKFPGEMKQQELQNTKLTQETSPSFQDRKMRREESIKSGFKIKEEDRKSQNEFFSNLLQEKPMAGESASKYTFTMEAKDASGQLLELLESNPKSLRELDVIGNNKGQRVGTIRKRLLAALIPARAGASQSPSEQKLVKDMSSDTGFAAMLKDPEDLKFRLSEINRSMSRQAKVMNPTEEDRGLAKHLLSKGHSKQDVYDYLQKRGG